MNIKLATACLFLLVACTDRGTNTPADVGVAGLLLPDSGVDSDIPIIDIQDSGPSQEYQQLCWKRQYYFCTPTGSFPDGDDPALYQQEMIIDICDESGVPCTPQFPGDPDCAWEIISQGECENWLECNPQEHIVHEDLPCQILDESGNSINGLQDFYCEKGTIIPGPCEPCSEEICDGIDNDCNNIIDDLPIRECENQCGPGELICINGQDICFGDDPEEEICDHIDNDCDGDVDEGQLNACMECGPVPIDICNGIDDDCNGTIDLDNFGNPLVEVCQTVCGIGQDICIDGEWFCDAVQPEPEICDGIDNDCNGLVDDTLNCQCPVELIGALIPCQSPPLLCGQGFMTCECTTPDCSETQYTPCLAACTYVGPPENCDPQLGIILPETCNNWDDDCNTLIDDNIEPRDCYTGPPETINVGICHGGHQTCHEGTWGFQAEEQGFLPDICGEEQIPLEEELCNNQDDDCDGLEAEEMEPTDIVFIIDTSGSMGDEIDAVFNALKAFAVYFSDQDVIKWSLIIGPVSGVNNNEILELKHQFSGFDSFMQNPYIADPTIYTTSYEQILDALYLSLRNISGNPQQQISWEDDHLSSPQLNQFSLNWREDSNKVVIIFTDEEAQSYLIPETDPAEVAQMANQIEDLFIYSFTSPGTAENSWSQLSIGGSMYQLTSDEAVMYSNLMEILDESACGGL